MRKLLECIFMGCAVFSACAPAPDLEVLPATSTQTSKATTSAEPATGFDIGAIMRQVHFAFRPEGSQYQGGHTTYGVQVAQTGRIDFTPYMPTPAPENKDPTLLDLTGGQPSAVSSAARAGVPLALETVSIGGQRAALRQVRTEQDGSLALQRGNAVERLRNTEEGVEQSWDFAAQPRHGEDLVVRVRAEGLRYLTETGTGLHFVDPQSGLGVRYGHGRWVDQEGKKTEVAARWVNGEVVLQVPQSVLAVSSYPAVLDPTVGPELGVDRPTIGPRGGGQQTSAIAFDGTNYLVVWEDQGFGSPYCDIYGTRVNRNGGVLDPAAIPISVAAGDQRNPAVAFNGTDFLVAWEDGRGGNLDIYTARVSRGGVVRDPNGNQISSNSANERNAAIASKTQGSINNALLVWERESSATDIDIKGVRLNPAGLSLDNGGFSIAISLSSESKPAVAANNSNPDAPYLVVWQDGRNATQDIYGTRVFGNQVLDTTNIPISTAAGNQITPTVAYGNGSYLVTWEDSNTGAGDIYGVLVSTTGVVQGSAVRCTTDTRRESLPTLAFDGTNFTIAYVLAYSATDNDILARRVSSTAALVGAPYNVDTSTTTTSQPAIAFDGYNYLVAYDYPIGVTHIYGRRLTKSGTSLGSGATALSTEVSNAQVSPAVAYGGANYLVVWRDDATLGVPRIRGALVSGTGQALTPAGIAISGG